jgi:hypothetical protein
MIQEAIDTLVAIGKECETAKAEGKKAREIKIPGDGRTVLFEREGEFVTRDVPPANRAHTVATAQDLIASAKKWGAGGVIWISPTQAVLVTDDADRRETVTLPFSEGKTWKFLSGLEKGNGCFDQPAMIRALRTELVNAANQPDILTTVRKIKFRTLAAGTSDLQHGNESMGQQIENEVSGAGEVPERLTVDTHVYSNLGEREVKFSVALDLEIDAANRRFILKPIADEIERVSQAALLDISDRIAQALPDYPLFFGRP